MTRLYSWNWKHFNLLPTLKHNPLQTRIITPFHRNIQYSHSPLLPTTIVASKTITITTPKISLLATQPYHHTLSPKYFAMKYSTETPKQTQNKSPSEQNETKPTSTTTPSSPSSSDTTQTIEGQDNTLVSSVTKRIKSFVKKYGPIGVVTYFTLYYATWASLYLAVDNGYIISNNVIEMLSNWGLDKWFDLSSLNSKAGSVAVSWVLTKFTEPLRVAITVGITPTLVKWWTNKKTEQ